MENCKTGIRQVPILSTNEQWASNKLARFPDHATRPLQSTHRSERRLVQSGGFSISFDELLEGDIKCCRGL